MRNWKVVIIKFNQKHTHKMHYHWVEISRKFACHLHICQLSRIIRKSPACGTDPQLSRTGHQISEIKWTFELFFAFVGNLAHFSHQNSNFFYSLYGFWDIFEGI